MATVVDTSLVLAALRPRDEQHERARGWIETAQDDLVTSPLALTEMDYFAGSVSAKAADLLWRNLETGAYLVRWWADALAETIGLARRWQHLEVGLVDASLVALAARLNTNRIATFDHRHFRVLTTVGGEPFVILPEDD